MEYKVNEYKYTDKPVKSIIEITCTQEERTEIEKYLSTIGKENTTTEDSDVIRISSNGTVRFTESKILFR